MTEAEWRWCEDPLAMFSWMQSIGWGKGRKLRLAACGCLRRVWGLLSDPRCRRLVEASERLADGGSGQPTSLWESVNVEANALEPALAYLDTHTIALPSHARYLALRGAQLRAAVHTAWPDGVFLVPSVRLVFRYAACLAAWGDEAQQASISPAGVRTNLAAERSAQAGLLRDLFGDVFCPVRIDASWLTWNSGTVVRLARSIYEERRWEDMPILGDVLEEAGCTEVDLLTHCQGHGPHARGCAVVDALLGQA
jgi:hypothetical protein